MFNFEKLTTGIIIAKDELVMSIASHELKTLITTIKASLQILQRLIERHVIRVSC